MRRRDMPVHRDRGVHYLNRRERRLTAPKDLPGWTLLAGPVRLLHFPHLVHEKTPANSGCTGIFPVVVRGTSPGDGAIAILEGAGAGRD
jgi:hypothetical protein